MIGLLTALTLAVPFLPQSEALCGGAAAAMVFRFLGDRHADVQQFQPLVDPRAGGIANNVLADAIRARGWHVEQLDGSFDTIRTNIDAGRPLILMLEDRPSRYHYVVAVAADGQQVLVHDPTWGPARPIAVDDLLRRWKPTGFWTLLVTPGASEVRTPVVRARKERRKASGASNACDRLLDAALDQIESQGPRAADVALTAVASQCPNASGPLRELAGIRFSQQRWRDAADLARGALERDADDDYAWDVLGSSRFILNEPVGALEAWNHLDKPMVDSVQIAGLSRTRYALISQFASLTPNTILTPARLSLAERRLRELPDRVTTAVDYRPDTDGFATVNVAIAERPRWPRTTTDWTSLGVRAAVDREVDIAVPGTTGQGELWEVSWRWWRERPRVGVSFAAPRTGWLSGLWRIDGSWEAQTYHQHADAPRDLREDQTHAAITLANWVASNLRIEVSSGLDVWTASDHTFRTGFVSGALDRREFRDRVSLNVSGTSWWAGGNSASFRSLSVSGSARSRVDPQGLALTGDIHADFVSDAAPLAVWPGAGEGRARPGLLRAHPLLDDGVISGPVFGRRVQSATLEVRQWLNRPQIPRLAVAAFADAAHATSRLDPDSGKPFQVDAGLGLRIRVPGSDRTLRVDYAHGLRDGADAVTVGFSIF